MRVKVLLSNWIPPQLLLIVSRKLTDTAPHPSWAVATPVALVRVSAGHSRVRSGGQMRLGGDHAAVGANAPEKLAQPLLTTGKSSEKVAPQAGTAMTGTAAPLVAHGLVPLPE